MAFTNLLYTALESLIFGVLLMDFVYRKPVLTFYRERHDKPEREAFAVAKAKKLAVLKSENSNLSGMIEDFFPLMGDVDCISSAEGRVDQYVVCWFDDAETDLDKSFRRLTGVTFSSGLSCKTNEKGKKTYNAAFKAVHGLLK
jgi:hypothetical protein